MTQTTPPTTVFVHGFLDDAAVWDRVLTCRSRRTPTRVADLAGMAGRPEAGGPYTLARHTDDVVGLIDGVSGPVVLVGQSMGAQVAELAAAQRPDRVAGMVLVSPVPLGGTGLSDAEVAPFKALGGDAEAQRAVRLQLSASFPGDELERLDSAGELITAEAARETVEAWNDGDPVGASASSVTVPVLVLRGQQDPFVTGALLETGVVPRFSQVATAEVEGAGHWPHLERPDTVAALVDDLVARVTPAQDPAVQGVGSSTAEGVQEQGWTTAFAERDAGTFSNALAPEVVLRASVLRAPVEGRDAVSAVMGTASGIYTSLVFTHEARSGDRTYLEWEATLHDGTEVAGVTRLLADVQGRTVDVAIHHRPLDGALRFSDELGRRLEGRVDRARFHRA
jgi:pimeloyl-ACP methyl ester carboxylesterase